MAELFDISIDDFFENDFPSPILNEEEAIKQSLRIFLSSSPSDFIYGEENGGVIRSLLFRQLTESNTIYAKYRIKNAIINGFFPTIIPTNIDIKKDTIKKSWVITIAYNSPITNIEQKLDVFVKDLSDRNNQYKLIDIPYTGENLVNFSRLQRFKYPDDKLIFKEGKYIFNKFVLINFNKFSSNFNQILEILG
jgi:hypothetical protein